VNNQIKRNYLEITSINELVEANKPHKNIILEKVDPPDFHLNKFFYKEIGRNHRWTDRLSWTDENWIKYISNSSVVTYILKNKEDLVGYFEQNFNNKKSECEIAYFGILVEYFGKKLGGYLLSEAIKKSFEKNSKRVWVHTCSLDHKHALNNYISRGMKVFKTDIIRI
tara:strand:+ start:228 stop:731 length:504 start_codon:yes stop_codon:yes gene_type:complete